LRKTLKIEVHLWHSEGCVWSYSLKKSFDTILKFHRVNGSFSRTSTAIC
jgi:hypothetical protein